MTRDEILFIYSKMLEAVLKLETLLIVLELINNYSSLKPLLITAANKLNT
jgi:hypothetical protein